MCETENVGRVHARRPEGSEVRSPGPSLFSATRIVPDRYPEGQLPGSLGPLENPRILVPVNREHPRRVHILAEKLGHELVDSLRRETRGRGSTPGSLRRAFFNSGRERRVRHARLDAPFCQKFSRRSDEFEGIAQVM